MIARVAIALVALVACACEAVPEVTYADDGSPDGGSDSSKACPDQVPPYATMCCGPIACFGAGCVATCNDCESRCLLADLCCPNAQSKATCHAGASCP